MKLPPEDYTMVDPSVCESVATPGGSDERVAAHLLPLLAARLAGGGAVWLAVRTGSMAPFLRPGDRVCVAPATPASLHPGDILLLAAHPYPLLHRLLAIRWRSSPALLYTKGDAAPRSDTPFLLSAVLGRAVTVERGGVRLACAVTDERSGACGACVRTTGGAGRWLGPGLAALSRAHARVHALPFTPLRRTAAWLLRRGMGGLSLAAWHSSRPPHCERRPMKEA